MQTRKVGAIVVGGLVLACVGMGWATVRSLSRGSGGTNAAEGAREKGAGSGAAGQSGEAGAGGSGAAARGDAVLSSEEALRLGREHIAAGRFADASGVLGRAVEFDPTNRALRLACAEALTWEEKFAAAYGQFEAATAIDPGDAAVHFDAGTVANSAGLVERAEEHYAAAVRLAPTEARYALYLGVIQIKLGKRAEGKASLVRAVALDAGLAEGWGVLAEAELSDGEESLALMHARRASEVQPGVTRWTLLHARALKRSGKAEEAAVMLLGLDEQSRRDRGVMQALAECYGLLRRPKDAAEMFAKAAAEGGAHEQEWAREAAAWYERAGDAENAGVWRDRANGR